ncbi:1aa4508f-33fe-49eb-a353-f432a91ea87e [Sclerotinia trifoliorum]|uniref:1aa4508f-33fe-49eb-a353-f432a91ea87e n=1 Tax=Sclerotinia trifoliorum TaxID=28548 RepID=A0A8H2ZQU9_9HELO|nr:1aa4508f-33fe-49eb-a353-f432a91ea87e [Sclerotinia trifoliorum]
MIKISILLLYRSIFPSKTMTLATNLVSIFVLLWGISTLVASIFSCKPINGYWESDIMPKCINFKWFFVGNSLTNIMADIVILGLPMPPLWHLKMSRRLKTAVSGMFLLGGFVVIASGLRVYFVLKMDDADMTWSYVGMGLWTAVEIDVAVISACLPTLRPVVTYLVPSILRSKNSDTGPMKESKEPV